MSTVLPLRATRTDLPAARTCGAPSVRAEPGANTLERLRSTYLELEGELEGEKK
ncbi:hypothetical protein AB0C59_27020 [Streptomyces sp. NPDC048664]|uniref:hypothetical protein n=1 Tax=Streptomyces sp. NPDC048664 TaxID=3154505 RepID=UPI0034306D18